MIWGVGTARCGTMSLAVQMGGLHEPEPKFTDDCMGEIDDIIEARMKLDTKVISDHRNSFVIDRIRFLDPNAEFVWLLRDPASFVASFIRGHGWTSPNWHGHGDWFTQWEDKEDLFGKAIYWWTRVNGLIQADLRGSRYTLMPTHYLDTDINQHFREKGSTYFSLENVHSLTPLFHRYKSYIMGAPRTKERS